MGKCNDLYMQRIEEEESELINQLDAGVIDQTAFDKAMRGLHQEVRERAADAAEHAYDLAMGR